MDYLEIWEKAKKELRDIGLPYSMWIEPLRPLSFENNSMLFVTVHALAPQLIKSQHDDKMLSALRHASGVNTSYQIFYDEDYAKEYHKEKRKELLSQKKQPTKEEMMMNNLAQMQSSANLNLKYKFSNFVVGENNRMAHAVAITVAQNPAKKYNPLFIYGASGLGKTHLMQAIGHYIIFNKPKLKVKYIKTEEYVNELINNIRLGGNDRTNRMDKFRQKYRNVDVLLIDDIQFLESKTRTMEEIFHTFDSLYNNDKQIVITSDRLPKDIPTLPERLRTRFEMGIMVDLTPPDFETRVAILQNLAEMSGISAEFSVFEYIANNFKNNVRELEGAFNKVSAFADIEKIDLTLEFAKKVLKCEEQSKQITISDIMEKTAKYYDVTVDDFMSSARNQNISFARRVAVYIARELTKMSFEAIGEYLNKKHTTMLYSYDKIKTDMKTDRELEKSVNEIIKQLKG